MRLACIILVLALTSSCEKTVCKESNTTPTVKAMVQWDGPPEADGLGWVLRLENGEAEKPSNLADYYKRDSLQVLVQFEKTNERFPCHCSAGSIEMVRIISISKL